MFSMLTKFNKNWNVLTSFKEGIKYIETKPSVIKYFSTATCFDLIRSSSGQ